MSVDSITLWVVGQPLLAVSVLKLPNRGWASTQEYISFTGIASKTVKTDFIGSLGFRLVLKAAGNIATLLSTSAKGAHQPRIKQGRYSRGHSSSKKSCIVVNPAVATTSVIARE